jgi:protoheme ferro-lyase
LRSAYAPLRILKVSAVDIGSIGTAFRPQPIDYPESIISQKSKPGKAHVSVVPIGFVADHLEIPYEIEIEARKFAQSHELDLKRIESLNTGPKFVTALADVVRKRLE